ncbi:MAG: GGDEF domain-containing protein [Magnetococcales bacterium]|nr:GGDEF domain-containing protein [Magnetococcales bacterium]NGZ25859.1 GGDEF domain-containing protein [Magnetococcales bacterium]
MDDRIQTRLLDVYRQENNGCLTQLSSLVTPNRHQMVQGFLQRMQEDKINKPFLDNKSVCHTLQHALEEWLQDLFRPRTPQEVETLLQGLRKIGERHAQLNVPLVSIQLARSLLKEEVIRLIMAAPISQEERLTGLIVSDQLLDLAISNINQEFIGGVVDDARHAQSLKLQAVGLDIALQSESLRAALFDWHRRVTVMLFLNPANACNIPSIRTTDFGLWVYHKGDLLFPSNKEIERLKGFIEEIDTLAGQMFGLRPDDDSEAVNRALVHLEELVSSAAAVLSSIKEQTLAMEAGRDALTKLFNRRFLRTILQREVATALKTGQRFAAILADVDYFKKINDQNGHTTGDMVLTQMAEILITTIRAGDFVFRYGGEEFLIILNDINQDQATKVAEKVRKRVAGHPFTTDNGQIIHSTVSLGVAMYDNHPDYNHTLKRADEALYGAKEAGRNRWHLAPLT